LQNGVLLLGYNLWRNKSIYAGFFYLFGSLFYCCLVFSVFLIDAFRRLFKLRVWKCFIVVSLWLCWTILAGQTVHLTGNLSNLRTKTLPSTAKPVQIDSLAIAPGSVVIMATTDGNTIDNTHFTIHYGKAMLEWVNIPNADSVTITYRALPFQPVSVKTNKDTTNITPIAQLPAGYYQYQLRNQQTELDFFNMNGLDYSGSFGRGITVGSNQDATVNANFNLQMNGKLPGDIEITAALQDNNVPFQPEGNTQQIQEFDRIYIQLRKNRHSLLLGDYDLRTPLNSYFMQYVRRLQGINMGSGFKTSGKNGVELTGSAAGAMARGSYHRLSFDGLEGNQGPYRLTGANGEVFIIVLSGSERVFIDGKLLERGATLDYIIDYNTAEITFTPRQIINKDKRITIEFQYTNQTYLRSLVQANAVAKQEKITYRVNYFSEQDAKSQLLTDVTLPDNYLSVLQNIGNNIEQAVLPGWQNTGFNPDRVMYQLIDTVVNGMVYDSVFVYSVNPAKALYAVTFSFVGEGNGNYRLADGNINGRAYTWITPDSLTGAPRGSFEPLLKMITPKRNNMMSMGADFTPTARQKWSAEFAVSNFDPNSVSDIDNQQNKGFAARLGYQNLFTLSKQRKITLLTTAHYEFLQQQFKILEPYREIEFTRNWSLPATLTQTNEHLAYAGANLKIGTNTDVQYRVNLLVRQKGVYSGFMHTAAARYQNKKGWAARVNLSFLTSAMDNAQSGSRFLRPNGEVSRTIGKKQWQMGARAEQEQNRFTQADAILPARSFYYNQTEVFVKTPDTSANRFALNLIKRWDYAPMSQTNDFALANTGNTLNLNGALTKNPRHQFSYNFTYRNLQVIDSTVLKAVELNSVLGEVNFTETVGKGWLRTTTQYQIGSGQRQQTEFYYEKVSNGMGNFVWLDNNNNGLEELDEFFPANENNLVEARYIRIVLPTGKYQPTNIVQFNQALFITPKAVWFNQKGIKKIISLFSTQSSLSIRRETTLRTWQAYLPLGDTPDFAQLVAESANIQNALFINRNSPNWEVSVQQLYLSVTNFLVNGADRRLKTEWKPGFRVAPSTKTMLRMASSIGKLGGISQAFATQNYRIRYWSIDPAADLVLNKRIRFTGSYTYKFSADYLTESLFPARQQKLTAETQLGNAIKSNITARLSYAHISYKGAPNTAAAYNLLDGLLPGSNYLWSINLSTRLANNMQLNFGYDGRKAGNSPMNHTGRASVQALF